ncbi:MAG TPA: alpha/beta fold hydrolase [Anaerolineaceae bacterium]
MNQQTVNLSYDTYGKGIPILLIHGFPLNRSIWDAVIPSLSENALVIVPDLRGFGKSPVRKDGYSMDIFAEDILDFLNRLGIEKIAIAGHSMGGYVALAVARKARERLSGLGLVCSRVGADSPERRESRYLLAARVLAEGAQVIGEGMPAQLSHRIEIQERIREIIQDTEPEVIAGALIAMAERPDQTDLLADLNVPVLFIAGSDDLLSPPALNQQMHAAIPGSLYFEISGAGHMPMMEAPAETSRALRYWIDVISANWG